MNNGMGNGIGVGDGYPERKILSVNDCQAILELLGRFKGQIEEFNNSFAAAINTFNTDATVQSFYASGNYGRNTQERLTELGNGVKQILSTLSDDGNALIPRTKQVLEEQISLLLSSSGVSGGGNSPGIVFDR